jgi:hypothetical protein
LAKKKTTTSETPQQNTTASVNIDGVDYPLDQLSEGARDQLLNLQGTDREIIRLKQQLAIFQTARAAYAAALKRELPASAAQ